MPLLDILDSAGNLDGTSGAKLYAYMLFPQKEEAIERDALFYTVIAERPLKDDLQLDKKHILFDGIALEKYRQTIENTDSIRKRYLAGYNAGMVLQAFIIIENHYQQRNISQPLSLERVVTALDDYFQHAKVAEEKIRFNAKDIKTDWRSFKPVAHLWASYTHAMELCGTGDFLRDCDAQQVDKVLQLAYAFLERAENIKPFSSAPVLTKGETYTLPDMCPTEDQSRAARELVTSLTNLKLIDVLKKAGSYT